MAAISDITIGETISFTSKAVNDNNFYYGIVVGEVTSAVAKQFDDITTYNTSVQSQDATVPDVTLQTFLLIQLLEAADNSGKFTIPFSTDWINVATLSIVATQNNATITVYGVNASNIKNVLNLLIANDFPAKCVSLN